MRIRAKRLAAVPRGADLGRDPDAYHVRMADPVSEGSIDQVSSGRGAT